MTSSLIYLRHEQYFFLPAGWRSVDRMLRHPLVLDNSEAVSDVAI